MRALLLSFILVFGFSSYVLAAQEHTPVQMVQMVKLAEQGNAPAQTELAIHYYNGTQVKQDYKKAYYWFEKAAKQKDAKAQYYLGQMYALGHGVKQNVKDSLYWYGQAVDNKVKVMVAQHQKASAHA